MIVVYLSGHLGLWVIGLEIYSSALAAIAEWRGQDGEEAGAEGDGLLPVHAGAAARRPRLAEEGQRRAAGHSGELICLISDI